MTTEKMKRIISAINIADTELFRLITIYENATTLELSPAQMDKLKNKATMLKEAIITKLDSLPF